MQENLVPVIDEVSQALLILDIFGDRRLSSVYMQNFNVMLAKYQRLSTQVSSILICVQM